MADKDRENRAEEPQPSYGGGKKKIVFTSLENLEEKNSDHTRNLSYAERMEYLLQLNQNLFGFDWSEQVEVLRKGIIHIRRAS